MWIEVWKGVGPEAMKKVKLTEVEIAKRIAREIDVGMCVNIGAGMPFEVSQQVEDDCFCLFHIEHGILGVGKVASEEEADNDLMGLGRRYLKAALGASCFPSVESFVMLRGGHIDLSILGAYQVSSKGDIANWRIPGKVPVVGGAMDIVGNVPSLFVMMRHVTRSGMPKILEECTFPPTGYGVVTKIFTDLAVIDVAAEGL